MTGAARSYGSFPRPSRRARSRITSTADASIAQALGNPPATEVAEVMAALEMVAERLGPRAGARATEEAS